MDISIILILEINLVLLTLIFISILWFKLIKWILLESIYYLYLIFFDNNYYFNIIFIKFIFIFMSK